MSVRAQLHLVRGEFTLDVDLTLPGRGVTAILGRSGSGKTTLLRAIAGLERCDTGVVAVGSRTWQDGSHWVPPHRRPVGFVFQEASLFPHLTVAGNIDFGHRRVPVDARRVSPADMIAMLGLETLRQRRPDQLSGGEQQRVAIARALATSPALLLMDEPLAALDPARRSELLPWLETLHRDLEIPVLYVTHTVEEALRLGDTMVVLEAGKVIATGHPAELAARLDLPPGQHGDAPSMIVGQVTALDEEFGLATVDFRGGRMTVPARGVTPGKSIRLLIRASDVSLALDPPSRTSILNVLPGTVVDLAPRGPDQVAVRVRIGETELVARITRKSAVALDLAAGAAVQVQVKSVAVIE